MKKTIIILITIITISSCDMPEYSTDLAEQITGNWSHISYSDSIQILEKVAQLPEDEYAISFRTNDELMEWKNIGWCGTPPVAYGEHLGTWEVNSDSVITINGVFWGGDVLQEWKIISINNNKIEYYLQLHETYNLED